MSRESTTAFASISIWVTSVRLLAAAAWSALYRYWWEMEEEERRSWARLIEPLESGVEGLFPGALKASELDTRHRLDPVVVDDRQLAPQYTSTVGASLLNASRHCLQRLAMCGRDALPQTAEFRSVHRGRALRT